MELEKQFIAIKNFLKQHQFLHEQEALERYPLQDNPYSNWIKSLQKLELLEVLKVQNLTDNQYIQDPGYKEYLITIKGLLEIKEYSDEVSFPRPLERKVSQKKRHEIKRISAHKLIQNSHHFIDIGSGAGHLSSALLYNNNKYATCLDRNSNFQHIGIDKLKREIPELLDRMEFQQVEINETTNFKKAGSNTALIGLHSCGDLSVHLIKKFTNQKINSLLNLGCCYHKLNNQNINLSSLAKSDPLKLTNHALTMAAKIKPENLTSYEQKYRVKKYRYGLHILMRDQFSKDFLPLGNATADDYRGPFSRYAKKYFPLSEKLSDDELNNFYHGTLTQESINQLLCLGVIRSQLAKLIEYYLIFDRALFIKEQGFNVEVFRLFDPKISPRNIALTASLN